MHDLLSKASIDRGLVYSARTRILNNMFYVRNINNEKPSIFIRGKPIFSLERMLHKDNYSKNSVEKSLFVGLKGLGAKKN
jgi:hypothetical protein